MRSPSGPPMKKGLGSRTLSGKRRVWTPKTASAMLTMISDAPMLLIMRSTAGPSPRPPQRPEGRQTPGARRSPAPATMAAASPTGKRQAQPRHHQPARESAPHEGGRVRQVDDIEHPEDQGEAHGVDAVQGAARESVYEVLSRKTGSARSGGPRVPRLAEQDVLPVLTISGMLG